MRHSDKSEVLRTSSTPGAFSEAASSQ